MTRRTAILVTLTLIGLGVGPRAARGQSAIAGVVRDTTGAVLPGVTVDASSPALIEKTRSVTTDGEGQYKIVDLRPGLYTVVFSLAGFGTIKRDAIELPSNFTAQINADLKVGEIEEAVTVTGASPIVDVQNAVQQTVLNRQLLDAVPTGRSVPTLGVLLPGARLALPDVGGTSGMQNRDLTVHGSDGRDTTFQVDGMTLNGIEGDGSVQSYFNEMMFEEISYQTSAISAEVSAGGVRANMIPRDGGNTFKGSGFFSGATRSLQSRNDADARAQGLTAPDALNKVWDFNLSEGGPIRRDRLWFFTSYRDWGVYQYIANSFFTDNTQTIDDASIRSGMVRLTTHFGGKHKVAAYLDRIRKFRGHENSAPAGYAIAGEATDIRAPKQYYTTEAKYTATLTSRLLVEAGLAINNESYSLEPLPGSVTVIPRRDTILQRSFGAYDGGLYYREPIRRTAVGSVSYVTGSHAFKAGVQYGWGYFWRTRSETADLIQLYRSGLPAQVIIHNTPQNSLQTMNADQGVYAQDSWTLGRWTINPGVRFEHFNSSIGARDVGVGRFVPARHFEAQPNLPNWNDISPRFGFAWDIHGNGRTAVKVGTGKYVRAYSTGFAETYDPNFYSTATLTWSDLNADDIAQGGIAYLADGSRVPCGYRTAGCEIDFSTLASTFGVKPSQRPAADLRRPYQIETNISVQREILPGTSITASYFRRDYKNLIWSDNVAIDPSDYAGVTVPSPVNPAEAVTIFNLNPAKASAVDILDQNSTSNFRKYSGYDVSFSSRMRDLTMFGGVSVGHTITNTCEVEDPNFLRYCDQRQYDIPWFPQLKLNGSYLLPWQLQVSATLQSYAGDARNATVDTTIAAVDPSLRINWSVDRTLFRTLTGGSLTQSSVIVPLIPPGAKQLDRYSQLDLRFKRRFRVSGVQLEAQADAYNALNTGAILNRVQTFGTALDRPASILQGRLIRFGLQTRW
jgi:Carboxypeptidase regulatory-like domain